MTHVVSPGRNPARACILSVSGPVLTPGEAALLARANPWGVILMGRSCVNPGQVRALVESIWTACGRPALVFIDQEGGRVRRLRPPSWPDFPSAGTFAALYARDPEAGLEAAWLGHRLIAAELEPMGVRANCAPVVDLLHRGAHQIVGDRAFGETPEQVSALARAALGGLAAGGVAGVIKHMPGHGRAEVDTHDAMPVVKATREDLEADLSAFRLVHDAPMAMTAHIAYAAFDADNAATVSAKVIADVIREDIGFDGLLMTDDLGMNALGGSLGDRGSRAIAAGCDMLLHCSGFVKEPDAILAEMTEIASVAPMLDGEALRRAADAEQVTTQVQSFDVEEGRIRFDRLMTGSGTAAA